MAISYFADDYDGQDVASGDFNQDGMLDLVVGGGLVAFGLVDGGLSSPVFLDAGAAYLEATSPSLT